MQHEYLAAYITELALPEYSALQWLPSLVAAAAVLLARHACATNIPVLRQLAPWTPTLEHYSGYRCGAPYQTPFSCCCSRKSSLRVSSAMTAA